jgi:hypothetical protein
MSWFGVVSATIIDIMVGNSFADLNAKRVHKALEFGCGSNPFDRIHTPFAQRLSCNAFADLNAKRVHKALLEFGCAGRTRCRLFDRIHTPFTQRLSSKWYLQNQVVGIAGVCESRSERPSPYPALGSQCALYSGDVNS